MAKAGSEFEMYEDQQQAGPTVGPSRCADHSRREQRQHLEHRVNADHGEAQGALQAIPGPDGYPDHPRVLEGRAARARESLGIPMCSTMFCLFRLV